MLSELRSISSTRKDLVNFAHVMAVACAVIAGIALWRHAGAWRPWAALAALFICARVLHPPVLLPLQKAWMALAVLLGWAVSRIVLTVLYYAAFTTIGGIGRLFGKRFLEVDIDKNRPSYWIKRPPAAFDPKQYERQF
jgi:hypothetical protein